MKKIKYDVINPENTQKLIEEMIDEEDANYEEARKQLTITDQYYDWSNTIADRIIEAIEEGEEIEKEMIDEYNEEVKNFNKYGEAEFLNESYSSEKMEDIIERNNNRI